MDSSPASGSASLPAVATIVVGVDGSDGSRAALRFAVQEARLRKATLRVVHSWLLPVADAAPDPFLLEFPTYAGPDLQELAGSLEGSARVLIDTELEHVLGHEQAGIEIERVTLEGAPAAALVDAASDADLLVVGSRGHGALHGFVLGSVSKQCVSHAPCPVAIVPYAES
jgi:nucleotide-binding universal stress UspA family protein